jgi:hypothetical protein
MSVVGLTNKNFLLVGNQTKTLCVNVQGILLIYFKADSDTGCQTFDPVYAELVRKHPVIRYAICNFSEGQNRQVVDMARSTSTPITSVPVLVLYADGKPFAKFSGTRNAASVKSFIDKMIETISAPKAAASGQFMSQPQGQGQPSGQGQKAWKPDIGAAPSMKGAIRGGYSGGGGFVEDDEEPKLLIPDTVIPYNAPWEAEMYHD